MAVLVSPNAARPSVALPAGLKPALTCFRNRGFIIKLRENIDEPLSMNGIAIPMIHQRNGNPRNRTETLRSSGVRDTPVTPGSLIYYILHIIHYIQI